MGRHPLIEGRISGMQAWLQSILELRHLTGLSVAVVQDQELIWSQGFGHLDAARSRPVESDSLFRVASITKLFTATALVQLRDAGKLKLEDPLVKYLPWFQPQRQGFEISEVTLKHMLLHISGLPREAPGAYWSDFEFPDIAAIRENVGDLELAYAVEQRWKYSNLAYSLLGEVVRLVSGQPLGETVRQNIFAPLGMQDSTVGIEESSRARLASGYQRAFGLVERQPFQESGFAAVASAAAMTTTVLDLVKFCQATLAEDPKVVSRKSLNEMQRVHWLEPNWLAGQGLGYYVQRLESKTVVGHSGALRGYRSHMLICNDEKLAVIAVGNDEDSPTPLIAHRLLHDFSETLNRVKPVADIKTAPEHWQLLVGRYFSPACDLEVYIDAGQLKLLNPMGYPLAGSVATLEEESPGCFRMESPNGSMGVGELVRFKQEAGKLAMHMVGHVHPKVN